MSVLVYVMTSGGSMRAVVRVVLIWDDVFIQGVFIKMVTQKRSVTHKRSELCFVVKEGAPRSAVSRHYSYLQQRLCSSHQLDMR